MAKWVRNWHTPYVIDSRAGHAMAMLLKELFLVAGYTLNSDDGDAAWTSALNILVDEPGGANGFHGHAPKIYTIDAPHIDIIGKFEMFVPVAMGQFTHAQS